MDGPKQQRCAVPVSSDQEWATIPGRGRSAQPERARALENLAAYGQANSIIFGRGLLRPII
jgi:hypothetical protein